MQNIQLHLGDCLEVLKTFDSNSLDSLVTDPPAGISFMGKDWDHHKGGRDQWIKWMSDVMTEALRVLKPGAHGLVWALPRTSHWTATALENAGFEVRDVITHLFGSGFPKSLDISKAIDKAAGKERTEIIGKKHCGLHHRGGSNTFTDDKWKAENRDGDYVNITAPSTPEAKQWQGFGTALKPASEHWILVRKPISEKTVAANVLKWGCGGLNIDGCRIGITGGVKIIGKEKPREDYVGFHLFNVTESVPGLGRFPANLVLSHNFDCDDTCSEGCAVKELDEQSGDKCGAAAPVPKKATPKTTNIDNYKPHTSVGDDGASFHGDTGGASRFFYCAKASKADRNEGLDSSEFVWEAESWEKPDLSSLLENISQHSKAISDDALMDVSKWSTDGFGNNTTDQLQPDLMFTISTVLKLITELKTSNCFQSLTTRESIVAAIKTIEENGLNLAESVAQLSLFQQNTTNEETVYLLGVVIASCKTLLKIKNFAKSGNFHSTVKATKLMTYLCRLVTPPGGTILDTFMGSGSTGKAAKLEGFKFVGIEQSPEYFEIAKKRLL